MGDESYFRNQIQYQIIKNQRKYLCYQNIQHEEKNVRFLMFNKSTTIKMSRDDSTKYQNFRTKYRYILSDCLFNLYYQVNRSLDEKGRDDLARRTLQHSVA